MNFNVFPVCHSNWSSFIATGLANIFPAVSVPCVVVTVSRCISWDWITENELAGWEDLNGWKALHCCTCTTIAEGESEWMKLVLWKLMVGPGRTLEQKKLKLLLYVCNWDLAGVRSLQGLDPMKGPLSFWTIVWGQGHGCSWVGYLLNSSCGMLRRPLPPLPKLWVLFSSFRPFHWNAREWLIILEQRGKWTCWAIRPPSSQCAFMCPIMVTVPSAYLVYSVLWQAEGSGSLSELQLKAWQEHLQTRDWTVWLISMQIERRLWNDKCWSRARRVWTETVFGFPDLG